MHPKRSVASTYSHTPPPVPEPPQLNRWGAMFSLGSDGLKSNLDLERVSELFEVGSVARRDQIASGRGSDDYRGVDYVG